MPIDGYIDTVFGVDGDLTTIPDALDPSGNVSFNQGWPLGYELPTSDPGYKYVDRAQENYLFNIITAAIQQYQQNGIPPFITTTMNGGTPYSYSKYNQVLYMGVAYASLTNSNTDTPPSANWIVCNYSTAAQITIQFGASATAPSGMLLMDGSTIAMTSGGTYNGAMYSRVYDYIWTNYNNTRAPVSGGRGANAAADFSANKTIKIPDMRGTMPFIIDGVTLSNPSDLAGALTQAAAGSISVSGSLSHTLSQAEIPNYNIPYKIPSSGYTAEYHPNEYGLGGTSNTSIVTATTGIITSGGSGSAMSISSSGLSASFTGSPTSILPPVTGLYAYINY